MIARGTAIVCAAALLIGAPVNTPAANAHASAKAMGCGVGLVAGLLVGCPDWLMRESEHRALVREALKGDNEAALTLATFHDMRDGAAPDEGRQWRVLAAERGNCEAISFLRSEARGRAEAAKWRTRFRWNACKKEEAGR